MTRDPPYDALWVHKRRAKRPIDHGVSCCARWDVDRYRHEYVSLLGPAEASRLLRGRDTSPSSQPALFDPPLRE